MNCLDMAKYLNHDEWKKFRDGKSWTDVGVLKEKLESEDQWISFEKFAWEKWCEEKLAKEPTFAAWLFTPERFCNLVIAYWNMEK